MLTRLAALAAVSVLLTSSISFAAPRVQTAKDGVAVSQANTPVYVPDPETGRERSDGSQ